ncbi:hypothetical protein CHL78_003080 [Romboutsia weinsteinii]|uniref:Uncharacterized protein n=1 Tax=Romboutsia weinsteinii TaxID=2020949 RepID=A0A255IUS1_9FIRM|nr:hypothetical protein [Romboutsia weinsteinii]RDY28919.1 hypothetical protein CHL78_003080 [Romboutsia weinsteinii]
METTIEKYRKLSLEIILMLSKDNYNEAYKILEDREVIITELGRNGKIKQFKDEYKKQAVYIFDDNIKEFIEVKMNQVKKEIKEYQVKQKGNFIYASLKKENLNLFSKKI